MARTEHRSPPCKVCFSTDVAFFCRKETAQYHRCRNCGLIFQHPQPTRADMAAYADSQYQNGEYSNYREAREMKHAHFRHRLRQFRERFPSGRLLDIGCSCGYFLDVALESGYDAYGVEFSTEAIEAANPDTKKRIIHGNVNDLKALGFGTFDIVTAFDIVEHMEDPIDLLTQARALLKDGGVLILSTPDSGHVLRYLMGCRWPMLQPMQHTTLFTKKALGISLRKAGFTGERIGPAFKLTSIEYLFGQIKNYNPSLYRVFGLLRKIVSGNVLRKVHAVNIGELLAIAAPAPRVDSRRSEPDAGGDREV